MKNKVISTVLIFSLFSFLLIGYAPNANANMEDEFDEYLAKQINLSRINEAGNSIEASGRRMRRSTYLSFASGALYVTGALFAYESPELGSLMILGSAGLSIWSWVEGFKAQSDLYEGGEKLKNSVRPKSEW